MLGSFFFLLSLIQPSQEFVVILLIFTFISDVSQSNNPKIHSFRVISSRDATMNSASTAPTTTIPSNVTTFTSASINNQFQTSSDPSPCSTPTIEHQQLVDDNNKKSSSSSTSDNNQHHQQQKQQKPILMCFICKLSFGNTKSFSLHANTEHKLNLSESEKMLLCREYSSAIIQKNNDNENSQISFLEPLEITKSMNFSLNYNSSNSNDISKNNGNSLSDESTTENNDNNNNSNQHQRATNDGDGYDDDDQMMITSNDDCAQQSNDKTDIKETSSSDDRHPKLTPKSLSSLTRTSPQLLHPSPPASAALAAANVIQRLAAATGGDLKFLNNSADLSNLTSLLEQTKTLNDFLAQQQQQHQQQHNRLACPEHIDTQNLNDVDCKNCEFLNINHMSSASSPLNCSNSKSPMKIFGGPQQQQQQLQHHQTESNASSASSTTSSPVTSSVTPNSAQLLHQSALNQSNINTSPSFTIGACPDHMNGRPIGIDCAR